MIITVKTKSYDAQSLQNVLNPRDAFFCIVVGGNNLNEYEVIVDNDIQAMRVKGMLAHCGIQIVKEEG